LIEFSIQNSFHPRGKIFKKIKCQFTLGNLIEIMAKGFDDDTTATNDSDTYGYSIHWWNIDQKNQWIDDLLILSRVFPELAKALMLLPVVDVISLQGIWGCSLAQCKDKIRGFAEGVEWLNELYRFNFSLTQLANLVGVADPLNVEEIGERLQDIDSTDLIIPDDWKRRHVLVRSVRTRRKPTTLIEIASCNSKQDLVVLLKNPPPTSLEAFSLALKRWISYGLGKESGSDQIEKNVLLISWLGKSKFIPDLQCSEPELWSAYRDILEKWAADDFVPRHPMAGMIAVPKRLRRALAEEILAACSAVKAR
jgi:hypothetical protein